MRAVQTRQFRAEEDPDVQPDAVIGHLRELPELLTEWGGPQTPGRATSRTDRSRTSE
jgi:hypothetical protein